MNGVKSLEDLKKMAELPAEQRKRLHACTCEQVYNSYVSLFKKACQLANDPEQQFMLFMRSGELFKLTMQKNGFSSFDNQKKKHLHDTFKDAVSRMTTLETILMKKYDMPVVETVEKAPEPLAPPIEQKKSEEEITIPTVPAVKVLIQPRELIRIVESEKKSAVILDFRENQQTMNIKYTKGGQITVISIPREVVDKGIIYSTLKQKIAVAQRTFLSRLIMSDYVVLMDDDTPQMVEGETIRGSTASNLKQAVFDYNNSERPKNPPLFMHGGFKTWQLQYPMYVIGSEGATSMPRDTMDEAIASYKRASLDVQYPEISPKRVRSPLAEIPKEEVVKPPQPTANGQYPHVEPVVFSEPVLPSVAQVPSLPSVVPNENAIPAPAISVAKPESVPSSEHILEPPTSTTTTILPRPKTPPRLAGGESAPRVASVFPTNELNGVQDLRISHSHPSVDRTNKPGETVLQKVIQPSQLPIAAPRRPTAAAPQPMVDRSAKPGLAPMPPKQQQALMELYHMMAQNIRSNSISSSSARPGQTGLYNMGNTCFMNACLQALFQTPYVVDIFTRENFLSKVNAHNNLGTGGVISAVFSSLVDNVWSGEFAAFRPQKFLQVFANEVNSMLMNGQQQDASEFYMILLASLHEDTNQVWKGVPPTQNYTGGANIRKEALDFDRKQMQFSYSPISKILYPRTVSEVTCATCHAQSITFEDVNIIQVSLPPESRGRASLTECLQQSFSAHNLDGRWECPRCKVARPATQKLSVWSLPPVVVVHLLRFSFTGGDYVKNDIPVVFDPDHLEMSPFLHSAAERPKESSYRLYSVTNHRGRLNSGHYTAISRHLRSDQWMRCDDETVNAGRAADIDFSAAYILYFKRKGL